MEQNKKTFKELFHTLPSLVAVKKIVKPIIIAAILILGIVASFAWYNLFYRSLIPAADIFVVERGSSIGRVAYQLANEGIITSARWFRWLAILKGDAAKIQVGEYKIAANMNQSALLKNMVAGKVVNYGFALIEGRTVRQLIQDLKEEPKIRITLDSEDAIAKISVLEGMFWPDTYFYSADTTDISVLLRANKLMNTKLEQMWADRDLDGALNNMYQAVILASIIEKETSLPEEYEEISGVYHRRLKKRIKLQADPTVIYGLTLAGKFKGYLGKRSMKFDSPYNTYKYYGLPPTPIAVPNQQALAAALAPKAGDSLYFVANGDGGHTFTATLKEHLQAVRAYKNKAKGRGEVD